MKLKDYKNEIKVLDIAALMAKAKALKIEIHDAVLDKNMSKLKDLKSISKKRKDLARIMTVLSQKKMISKIETKTEKVEKTEVKTEKTEKEAKEGGKK